MSGTDLTLLARTVVRLHPGQLVHRARLRTQRMALGRWPEAGRKLLAGPDPVAARGWPDGFRPVDARASLPWPGLATLAAGRIELLGVGRRLAGADDWLASDAPQLWRFHLHYWDWAWALAAEPDQEAARSCYSRLWRSWQAAQAFGRGDAWLPYPAALRAWSWCGQYRTLVAGAEIDRSFRAELALTAGFLRRHLESDVGGNHLIKDLKALIGLAVFFGDDRQESRMLGRLAEQVGVQVLADGGHYERAPAYHCQVLADLMDVADLLEAAGRKRCADLTEAIGRMRAWLEYVLLPDGQVPLFNDGYPVADGLITAVRGRAASAGSLVVLRETGLIRAELAGWHLLADCGPPCPDELPGHAHADTLSCLVRVDGAPLVVDTGTSTYAPGPVRDHERSTAAHSTVQVDDADSTEVWGAFRAGRRARVHDFSARSAQDTVTVTASHDGFRWLPGRPIHRRRWTLSQAGLRIDDEVTGAGRHLVTVRWHLAPDASVQLGQVAAPARDDVTTGVLAASIGGPEYLAAAGVGCPGPGGEIRVSVDFGASAPYQLLVESAPLATGFSRTVTAPVLVVRLHARLPVRVRTTWSRRRGPAPDGGKEQ